MEIHDYREWIEALKSCNIELSCIECTDEKANKDAEGVVGDLLKMALNPFKKAELPIRVFEASSNAERVMRYFKLAPYYLSKAAEE